MPKHIDNPEAAKQEYKEAAAPTAQKRLSRLAERLAHKSAKTVQRFDKSHTLFSK
jgi:hypothetical protein